MCACTNVHTIRFLICIYAYIFNIWRPNIHSWIVRRFKWSQKSNWHSAYVPNQELEPKVPRFSFSTSIRYIIATETFIILNIILWKSFYNSGMNLKTKNSLPSFFLRPCSIPSHSATDIYISDIGKIHTLLN